MAWFSFGPVATRISASLLVALTMANVPPDLPENLQRRLDEAMEALDGAYSLLTNERVWPCCALESLSARDMADFESARLGFLTAVSVLRNYRRAPKSAD
jgi:hypothetical protein